MWREVHDSHAVLATPGDAGVAELAARQHGVVSTRQLLAAGLARGAVAHRVHRGRLHPLHRGVYAVGHPRVTARGRLWAAVLATAAVLSHRTAAYLWELLPWYAGPIDVTTTRNARRVAGIRVHRSRSLGDGIVHHDGLPTTSLARTLVDLGDVLSPHRLTRVCHQAEVLRLLDVRELEAMMTALPGRRTRNLRAALQTLAHADAIVTRSELEERFLALLARHALPTPLVNTRIEGYEVDFAWPRHRLLVETDGAAAHRTRTAFQQDRRRDVALQLAGYTVLRFTHHDVTSDPGYVIATLVPLLRSER